MSECGPASKAFSRDMDEEKVCFWLAMGPIVHASLRFLGGGSCRGCLSWILVGSERRMC